MTIRLGHDPAATPYDRCSFASRQRSMYLLAFFFSVVAFHLTTPDPYMRKASTLHLKPGQIRSASLHDCVFLSPTPSNGTLVQWAPHSF